MKTVIGWGKQLFDALDYMYSKHHLVHRDIKPDNIFVHDDFSVKIGDLELIKYIEESCSGSSVGTERYISPSIESNGRTIRKSHRNDVYSLGLVLWEIIERRTVFSEYGKQGDFNRDRFIAAVSTGQLTELTPPTCEPQLQEIVKRSVNFDRRIRPDAGIVVTELKTIEQSLLYLPLKFSPIDVQQQEKLIRPIGFNGTLEWVKLENEEDSIDLDNLAVNLDEIL